MSSTPWGGHTASLRTHRTVVVADGSATWSGLPRSSEDDFKFVTTSSGHEAMQLLEQGQVRLVIVGSDLDDITPAVLLERVREQYPKIPRWLITSYDDLPELVRTGANALAERFLAQPVRPMELAQWVTEQLNKDAEHLDHRPLVPLPTLMRATVDALVELPGVVLRSAPGYGDSEHLTFVFERGQLRLLRERLLDLWRWPAKAYGQKAAKHLRNSPGVADLWPFGLADEVFERREKSVQAYVALLPWRDEPRITVVLGWVQAEPAASIDLLRELHHYALRQIPEFTLPAVLERGVGSFAYARDYNWVITPHYVGPDRRTKPTGFFSRYLFLGQRQKTPQQLRDHEPFVDQLPRALFGYILIYALLSLIDTAFTIQFIGTNGIEEANPLWRPFVQTNPALFALGKNILSLGAIGVVSRFWQARWGKWVLHLNVAIYAALDIYWLILLLG